MTRTLDLVHHTKATLHSVAPEHVMTIDAPDIKSRFAGKQAFTSPWMGSSTEPIEGTLNYEHERHLAGASDATVEVVDDQVNIEFRLVDGGLEDVVVATFKGGKASGAVTTTVLQGSWGSV